MVDIWRDQKRGVWCADPKDPSDPQGKKRLRWYLGPDELEARRLFHARMASLLGGSSVVPGRLTLAELADEWIEWGTLNTATATWKARKCYLQWLVDKHGHDAASSLTPKQIERIKRAHADRAPVSLDHFIAAVRGLYRWAQRQGLMETNPMRGLKGVPHGPRKRLALPMKQALAACQRGDERPPLGDWMRILLYTGMRRGELEGLSWANWDRRRGLLWVDEHKTAGRTGQPRRVALSRKAAEVLERQPRTGDAIFAHADGQPYTADSLFRRLRRLQAKGKGKGKGKPAHPELQGLTFHALRHTFCSELAIQDVHPEVARVLMGHQSAIMTRYYTDLPIEQLKKAVDRL